MLTISTRVFYIAIINDQTKYRSRISFSNRKQNVKTSINGSKASSDSIWNDDLFSSTKINNVMTSKTVGAAVDNKKKQNQFHPKLTYRPNFDLFSRFCGFYFSRFLSKYLYIIPKINVLSTVRVDRQSSENKSIYTEILKHFLLKITQTTLL